VTLEEKLQKIINEGVEKAAKEMLNLVEKEYGEVPYIFRFIEDQPELLITKMLYNEAVFKSSKALDQKTAELIAIAVSAALRCNHCLKLHMRVASRMGATDEEIAAAIFIAGSLANASILAVATRELEEKREGCNFCDVNNKKTV
jgi:AhpD family alkylhydroperoxidase